MLQTMTPYLNEDTMKWIAVAGIAVAFAALFVSFPRLRPRAGDGFARRVGAAIAEWYASAGKADARVVEAWVHDLFHGSRVAPTFPLAALEIKTVRVDSGRVTVHVILAVPHAEGLTRVTLTLEEAWHDLPDAYRERFLREREREATYALWSREQVAS